MRAASAFAVTFYMCDERHFVNVVITIFFTAQRVNKLTKPVCQVAFVSCFG